MMVLLLATMADTEDVNGESPFRKLAFEELDFLTDRRASMIDTEEKARKKVNETWTAVRQHLGADVQGGV